MRGGHSPGLHSREQVRADPGPQEPGLQARSVERTASQQSRPMTHEIVLVYVRRHSNISSGDMLPLLSLSVSAARCRVTRQLQTFI